MPEFTVGAGSRSRRTPSTPCPPTILRIGGTIICHICPHCFIGTIIFLDILCHTKYSEITAGGSCPYLRNSRPCLTSSCEVKFTNIVGCRGIILIYPSKDSTIIRVSIEDNSHIIISCSRRCSPSRSTTIPELTRNGRTI